jgi:hypothetical protein
LFLSISLLHALSMSLLLYVLATILLLVSMAAFPLFMVVLNENQFENQIVDRLQTIVLKMSLGQSFRSSFFALTELEKGKQFERETLKLYRSVTFPQQSRADFHSKRLNQLVMDLKFVNEIEYGAAEALRNLTYQQKMLSDFRRKSGKARAQVVLQAWILSGIQIAIMAFMISIFGIKTVFPFLTTSLLLSLVGHLISQQLGRRIRWRI